MFFIPIFICTPIFQRYKNDPLFAVDAKLITSIAFLPICDISLGIIALETYLPPELQPVLDWFVMYFTFYITLQVYYKLYWPFAYGWYAKPTEV